MLRKVGVGAVVTAVLVGAGSLLANGFSSDLGPIPVCNGEQATHVLIGEINGDPSKGGFYVVTKDGLLGALDKFPSREDAAAAATALYQPWADAGVNLYVNEDAFLGPGTLGHDVLVALVSTNHGGFVSDNSRDLGIRPDAGDSMCAQNGVSDDVVYAARFKGDYISTGAGSDDIYAGGGEDVIRAGAGVDFIWGYNVAAGETQKIFSGGGQDHHYVGRGGGDVEVTAGKPGQAVCPHHGPCAPGDHIHECPNDPDTVVDTGLEAKNFHDIYTTGIEYWGPEALLGNPAPFDPCAYGQKDL